MALYKCIIFSRNEFIKVSDTTALALHAKGRNTCLDNPKLAPCPVNVDSFPITEHVLLTSVEEYAVLNLGDCCQKMMSILMQYDLVYIRKISENNKAFWHSIRQFRITGSRCYQLFTYGKRQHTDEEWAIKISKYFWPQVFSNKFVKHGIQYELTARDVYIKNTGNNVIISGFNTSKKCPWLGYSPYGVVLDTLNNPKKLIEIKCPFKGSLVGLTELLSNVNFQVQGTDGQWKPKNKHAYYAQIQLGMIMLNVNNCDFIIFDSLEKFIFVINVEININFCTDLLLSLKIICFERMIHESCNHNINV